MGDGCLGGACGTPALGHQRRLLGIVLAVNMTMFVIEAGAGWGAQSVALQADALDFLGDSVNYATALFVLARSVAWRAGAALIKGCAMLAFGLFVLGASVHNAILGAEPEAPVMGVVGFAFFLQLLPDDYTPAELAAAQNALLLLMVLFVNVHIGNCRSETRSALAVSPLRSPVLLAGVAVAFFAHLGCMHFAPMQRLLGTSPVAPQQWIVVAGLALTVLAAMELHKLSWWWRAQRRT